MSDVQSAGRIGEELLQRIEALKTQQSDLKASKQAGWKDKWQEADIMRQSLEQKLSEASLTQQHQPTQAPVKLNHARARTGPFTHGKNKEQDSHGLGSDKQILGANDGRDTSQRGERREGPGTAHTSDQVALPSDKQLHDSGMTSASGAPLKQGLPHQEISAAAPAPAGDNSEPSKGAIAAQYAICNGEFVRTGAARKHMYARSSISESKPPEMSAEVRQTIESNIEKLKQQLAIKERTEKLKVEAERILAGKDPTLSEAGGEEGGGRRASSPRPINAASALAGHSIMATQLPTISLLEQAVQRARETSGDRICEHKGGQCGKCSGSGICEHNRVRTRCKLCGGGSICEHGRVRSRCKQCGGGSICPHMRERSKCVDCGGGSICQHRRVRSQCFDCGGGSVCPHRRLRSKCIECSGATALIALSKGSQEKDKDPNKKSAGPGSKSISGASGAGEEPAADAGAGAGRCHSR
jgi:hypothetical protein